MTQVTASDIFAFLEDQRNATIVRHEIALPAFRSLRVSVRYIVVGLGEAQDNQSIDISDQLRALVSEWLTVPLPFDNSMLDALTDLLGRPVSVQARWGNDMRIWYETALLATETLAASTNPIRVKLREAIQTLRSESIQFRIYCHRRARSHFESLFTSLSDNPLPEDAFLHSVRDYRDTKPFDELVKVGPLRARGWSSAPDALISAPRFRTLRQFVWSGCPDEPDFGYDPVSSSIDSAGTAGTSSATPSGRPGAVKWATTVIRDGDSDGVDIGTQSVSNPEGFWVFKEVRQPQDKRTATLIQVDDEQGILWPPHSRVLSFNPDPTAGEPIAVRVPGVSLAEGMFVALPIVNDVDLGSVHAEHGSYSEAWRKSLEDQWHADAVGLIERLHTAGLALVHLKSAIRNWLKPPSTVIHAPQMLRHFMVLMRVLGFDVEAAGTGARTPLRFSQFAWLEIRRSRGEAIQAGVHGQEIVDDELLVILKGLLCEIREESLRSAGFRLAIPPRYGIKGHFVLFKVCGIEEGFSAPDKELRAVRDLRTIDQWRD